MVVWQFTTIAALIGALLISVMVLTNRLGVTNALLQRIEEGLVRPQPVAHEKPVPMERTAIEQASVETRTGMAQEIPSAPEPTERDRRVSYLTVQDLKVIARSERRSSDIPMGVSPLFNEVFGRRHARSELAEAPAEAAPRLEVVAVDEAMAAGVERTVVDAGLAAATVEIRDSRRATRSPTSPQADSEPVSTEAVATEAELTEAELTEPVLTEAELTDAELTDAELTDTDLREPVLTEAELTDRALSAPVAIEPLLADLVAFVPATTGPAALESAIPQKESPAPEAAVAAAAQSEADEAAAREEKRKRDLLMHAYRRRRSR